ncbi:MAG TPA: hypothetical protein VGG87_08685, partial [Solirubrobacteraceae bacterium]
MDAAQTPGAVLAGLLDTHPTLRRYLAEINAAGERLEPGAQSATGPAPEERASGTERSDQLQATVAWMHDEPMLRGRRYRMQIGTELVTATIAPLKYKVNVESLEHVA